MTAPDQQVRNTDPMSGIVRSIEELARNRQTGNSLHPDLAAMIRKAVQRREQQSPLTRD
jgi:hypothetical protein